MNKIAVALGTILILSGLIILSVQGTSRQIVNDLDFRATDVDNPAWNISRSDFKAGEELGVGFGPGTWWAFPPRDSTTINGEYFPYVKDYAIIVIDETTGNRAEFDCIVVLPEYDPVLGYPSDEISVHPKIRITLNDALLTDNFTETEIIANQTYSYYYLTEESVGTGLYLNLGKVRHNGTYTLQTMLYPEFVINTYEENGMNKTEQFPADPPAELRLYKLTYEETYPYKFLLFASPVTISIGVIAFVWGSRRSRSKAPYRKLTQVRQSSGKLNT